jgi:hypothetical protein
VAKTTVYLVGCIVMKVTLCAGEEAACSGPTK